jgi:hypothetical protein
MDADAEPACDLDVRHPARDELEHLRLASRKGRAVTGVGGPIEHDVMLSTVLRNAYALSGQFPDGG